jgi:hypothetical protein
MQFNKSAQIDRLNEPIGRIMSKKIKPRTDQNRFVPFKFSFEADFPDEYDSLRALLTERLGLSQLAADPDFRGELGEIVYSHRREYPTQKNRRLAEQLGDDIMETIKEVSASLDAIRNLDGFYNKRIVEFMKAASPLYAEQNYNIGHVLRDLENAIDALGRYRLALTYAFYFEAKPQGRSRPPLPYYVQTVQLMDMWKRYARSKVVAPKGTGSGRRKSEEATQPSTEFVRLGLKMIDQKVSAANTMTLIKRVLADQKKYKAEPLSVLIGAPNTQDIRRSLEAWKKLEGKLSRR